MARNRTRARRWRSGALLAGIWTFALVATGEAAEVRNVGPWAVTSYDQVRLVEDTPQTYAPVVRSHGPGGAVWITEYGGTAGDRAGQFDAGVDPPNPAVMPAARWLGAGVDRAGIELIVGLTEAGFVEFAPGPRGTRVAGVAIAGAPVANVERPDLAVAANGDAILAWQQSGRVARNRFVMRRNGRWSAPRNLPARAGSVIRDGRVRVAISNDGRAIAGWIDTPRRRSRARGVRVALIEEGRTAPVIRNVSSRRGRVGEFAVGVSARRSLVVWTAPKDRAPTRVLMRVGDGPRFTPQKAIGRARQVTSKLATRDHRLFGSGVETGLDAAGGGFIVWAQQLGRFETGDVRVVGKRITANGSFTKAIEITPRRSAVRLEMVHIGMGVGPLGSAVLGVQSFDADGMRFDGVIAPAGRGFGDPSALAAAGDDRTTSPPVVVAGRAGGGGVMWESGTGSLSAQPVAAHVGRAPSLVLNARTRSGRLTRVGGARLQISVSRSTRVAVTIRRRGGAYAHAFITRVKSGGNTIAFGRFARAGQLPPGVYRVSVDVGGMSVLEQPLRLLRSSGNR